MTITKDGSVWQLQNTPPEQVYLSARVACAIFGMSEATFRKKVKDGVLPQPVPGLDRWNRRELESLAMGGQDQPEIDPIMEEILSAPS